MSEYLHMLNPYKFATYQFMKQYFSVSPKMFLNFEGKLGTDPEDIQNNITDYSYNDIIHMLQPFENEFEEIDPSSPGTVLNNVDKCNIPVTDCLNNINKYNLSDSRNSTDSGIDDRFAINIGGWDEYLGNVNSGAGYGGYFRGEIFAAFIPIFPLDRTKEHREIGYNIAKRTTSTTKFERYYSNQVYTENFYSTGTRTSYMTFGGGDVFRDINGALTAQKNFGIDKGYGFERGHGDGGYKLPVYLDANSNVKTMHNTKYGYHITANREYSYIDTFSPGPVGAMFTGIDYNRINIKTLTLDYVSDLSVFKILNKLVNGNEYTKCPGTNITIIEKQLIYASNIH